MNQNEMDDFDYYISHYYNTEPYLRKVNKKTNGMYYYCTTQDLWIDEDRKFLSLYSSTQNFTRISKEEALLCTLCKVWRERPLAKTKVYRHG